MSEKLTPGSQDDFHIPFQMMMHDFPPKAGRENWTCEMFVGNLYEIAKLKAEGHKQRVDEITKELNEKHVAFRDARLNPFARLIRWVNHKEQFAVDRAEFHLETCQDQLNQWTEWRDFLSAMNRDDKLSLNHEDFTFFFPGNSYSFVCEMIENPAKVEGKGL